MSQSRTPRPVLPHLEPLLLAVALTARQRRTAERFETLTLGLIQALGRRTITQLLLGLGHGDRDWSAAYRLFRRERVDLEVARRDLVAGVLRHVPRAQPLVVVLDATQIPRTSARCVGCGWLNAPRSPVWKPGLHRAQRWEGLSALLPRSPRDERRTVPLWIFPAPSATAKPWPGQPPCREWEAGLRALTWLRTELDRLGRARRRILAVADGSYGVAPLWVAWQRPRRWTARDVAGAIDLHGTVAGRWCGASGRLGGDPGHSPANDAHLLADPAPSRARAADLACPALVPPRSVSCARRPGLATPFPAPRKSQT